jgi:hypothetical protein
MMAAKSRPSPYPRNMDYTSYHHARMSMKEIYQGTPGSCGSGYVVREGNRNVIERFELFIVAGDSCESSDSDDATKKQGLKYYEFFKEIVKSWLDGNVQFNN